MDAASRYELLEKLGTGSFATVFRARDNELNREVAVRQIHSQYLNDPRFLDRYWAEAQLLASVQHPHIVTIYDIVRSQGWLVLELMQANLRDRMAGRPMDLRALRTTLIHALKALKYLHGRGVIHGDINPGNLMIDSRKRVKVGDFGIARRVARTDGSVSRGSAKYMAPEALSGDITQVGPSSDLYSLGFTCYELLCGAGFIDLFPGLNLQQSGDTQAAWMMWHAAPDRKLPPISQVLEGVPPDLAAVIEKLIQKNPKARYQSADEVLAQLGDEAKTGERESLAQPLQEQEPASKGPRWWVVALFLLSTLTSVGMFFLPSGSEQPAVAPPTKHAIIRKVDLDRNILEIEDQLTGLPEETPLPAKPRIRLIRQGENEQFILPRDIAPGDWIEIQPASNPAGEPAFLVARPIRHEGEVRKLDAGAGLLTAAILSGRLRDELSMHVPPRARVRLNGQPAALKEIRPGDRIEVEHLLDPTGTKGELISTLDAFRPEDLAGFVESIDLPQRTLTISEVRGQRGGRVFPVAADASLTFTSGQPLAFDAIRAGDRISIQADTVIRKAVVTRGDITEQGALLEVRKDNTILIRANSGNEMLLTLSKDADIRLGQDRVTIDALRPQYDTLSVTIHNAENGDQTATAIDASRPPKHDRWAIIIGNGAFDDRTLTPLPYITTDAQSLHRTLLGRYAVDPKWSALVLDKDARTVRDELQRMLTQVTEPMQLVVALLGHAYRGPDGSVYLALKDFRWGDMPASGIPLDEIIEALESCPARNKLLLLDLVHAGDHPDVEDQPDLPRLLGSLKTLPKTVRIVGGSSENERSSAIDNHRRGWFGTHLDQAYSGDADTDRDLAITSDELIQFLEHAATNSESPSIQHPFAE